MKKSRFCVKLVGTVRLCIAKLSRIFKIKQDFQDFQDCQDEEVNVPQQLSLHLANLVNREQDYRIGI